MHTKYKTIQINLKLYHLHIVLTGALIFKNVWCQNVECSKIFDGYYTTEKLLFEDLISSTLGVVFFFNI